MRNRLFLLTTSLSLLVVSQLGCILNLGGGSVADVRVTWSFAGVQRCAGVGIEEVTIQLVDKEDEGDPNVPAFGIAAPCVQGSALIAGVVAGEYRVVVTANGPAAAWDNGGGADVTVSAGPGNAVAAGLVASAGNGTIPLPFLDGRRCGEAGVVTVE